LQYYVKSDGTELMTLSTTGVNIPTLTLDSIVLDTGATLDLNGIADSLVIDADGDTTISAPTDDQIDIEISGADDFTITANALNVLSGSSVLVASGGFVDINGAADGLVIDADADTTISAPTDDQIDIEIAGADDFTFAANAFTALAGSTIVSPKFEHADLVLDSTNEINITIDDISLLAIDDAAIASNAAATDTAGKSVFVETQDGGVDGGTASTGQNAGSVSVKAGDGSAAVTTDAAGGNGGSITLTAGSGGAGDGSGVAGDPGKVQVGAGLFHYAAAQVIDMADAAVTLTLNPGTPAGTTLTSNVLRVDANSGATENLLLPPEADCAGVMLLIVNTGGESIVVQNDAGSTIDTVATSEFGLFFCDGTAWSGQNQS
jgi:hypothetical protein